MFRIATYNIRYGGTGRFDALLAVLKHISADVILLTEAHDRDLVRQFSRELNMESVNSERGKTHLAFLSRFPILKWNSLLPNSIKRPLLEVCLAPRPDLTIRLYGLHLGPHYFAWNERQRVRELNAYLGHIKKQTLTPHLLLGDFNAVAPEARFDTDHLPPKERFMLWWERGRVYRDAIQRLRTEGYTDCFRALYPDEDGFTLPTHLPQVRLDYMFADSRLAQSLKACAVVTTPDEARHASDHYPLVADFDL